MSWQRLRSMSTRPCGIAAYRVARTFAAIRPMSAFASSALVARVAPAASAVSARKAIGGASQSSRPNDIARAHLSFPFSASRALVVVGTHAR